MISVRHDLCGGEVFDILFCCYLQRTIDEGLGSGLILSSLTITRLQIQSKKLTISLFEDFLLN